MALLSGSAVGTIKPGGADGAGTGKQEMPLTKVGAADGAADGAANFRPC